METIQLYRPALEELAFRQRLLEDPETMAYNHACGGTIPFPRERWASWHERWVERPENRFYRYLREVSGGRFVGETAYQWDEELGEFICDVIVEARYRGRGYGRQGLALLCEAARERGVARLCDNIAPDNPSVSLFLSMGFRERLRNEEYVLVERTL